MDRWWVEAVAVEYLDCRRYAENGKLWTFDFGKIAQEEITQIACERVIIPELALIQNMRYRDWGQRALIAIIGLPHASLEDAEAIPEGMANKTCFPVQGNPIDISDPKRWFGYRAIVRDDEVYYQWSVAETLELEGKNHHWFKSDICDLTRLYEINRTIDEYENSPLLKTPTPEFVSQVSNAYKILEEERSGIRKCILEYHDGEKTAFDPKAANVADPPTLSYFESVQHTQNGYQVKTHMELLFFRSAARHWTQAKKASEMLLASENKPNGDALIDEIEHSTMCVISSINCLESYINYIIEKYLPKEAKTLERVSLIAKWLCVPAMLNLSCRFDPEQPPYADFRKLNKTRNDAVHYKPRYKKAKKQSKTASEFNFDKASFAIRVVKNMVTDLSSDGKIPTPAWIKTPRAQAEYWDEVTTCLQYLKDRECKSV